MLPLSFEFSSVLSLSLPFIYNIDKYDSRNNYDYNKDDIDENATSDDGVDSNNNNDNSNNINNNNTNKNKYGLGDNNDRL